MSAVDVSLYSAAIAIILGSVYALRFLHWENLLYRIIFFLPTWLGGRPWKLALQQDLGSLPIESPAETPAGSKYSPSWWTDEKLFELERRAIFSNTWIFATHASRFQKPGDYRTFEIAGFTFIAILGKDKQLRAFHNVCRHRAYAVTKKESGSSTVLGCRYHGWSYNTKGQLIKAPEFENVTGFDKDLNGLWEVKTEIRESMIFVNFDAGTGTRNLELGESESIMKSWRVNEMEWLREWKIEGIFNWKLAAGSFFFGASKETSYWTSFIPVRLRPHKTYLSLSNTTVLRLLLSGQLLTIRLVPTSTLATKVECNVYGRNLRRSKKLQTKLDALCKEVRLEIQQIELKQRELLSGNGQFHNIQQDEFNKILKQHRDAERKLGAHIHPAARKQNFTQDGMADDDLCKELETNLSGGNTVCGANAKGLLEW